MWSRGHVAIRVTRGGVWELLYRVLHIVLYSIMQMRTLLSSAINYIQYINNKNLEFNVWRTPVILTKMVLFILKETKN